MSKSLFSNIWIKFNQKFSRLSNNEKIKDMALTSAIVLVFLIALTLSVQLAAANTPWNLNVSSSSQTLTAGTTNNVTFTITNNGDTTADQIFVTISMPSSTTGGASIILLNSDGKYYIDTLSPTDSSTIPAQIYVSPSAAGNMFQLTFTIAYTSGKTAKTDTRTIGVNVPSPSVSGAVLSMSLSSYQLNVGQNNNLNLTVKNIGSGSADSLTVQLTLPTVQVGSSTVVLVGSDGIWFVGTLGPGQQQVIPLKIFISPAVSGSLMSLTVTSTYTDMGYKPKQQINYLGIIARGTVNLVILGTSTFPATITPGMPFSLTVNFINLGTTTAQSVILTPSGTNNLQPSSTDGIFLGDLAVNIPSSFTISYKAVGVTNGSYTVALNYTYKDSLGGSFANTLNVPFELTVGTSATTGGQGGQGQGGVSGIFGGFLPFIITIIVIVIVIAVILRIRSRRTRSAR